MADQHEPNQPNSNTPGAPGSGSRGRTIAIVVLSIVVALLIAAVIWMLVARGGTPTSAPTSSSPSATATNPPPSQTPTSTATAEVTTCATGDLRVTLGTANGAAGSSTMPIIFTNTGSGACELHGFPGVSFVGDGNGTQLGAAADEDGSIPIAQQHRMEPGQAVQAQLKIEQAQNFAGCTAKTADGLRIYPPHSTIAVFVKASGLTACTNSDIHLLTVGPVTGP